MIKRLTLACLVGILSCTAEDNPYTSISARNIFGLVPITQSITNAAVDPATLPIITCNGIMTIFGKKEVLFKVKPISETKEESYILSEGETVGNITVVSIDTTNAIISFLNNGTETTLGICYGTNSASAMAQPTLILDNTRPHFLTDADVTNYTAQSSFLERIKELRRESDGLPAPVPPIPLLQ